LKKALHVFDDVAGKDPVDRVVRKRQRPVQVANQINPAKRVPIDSDGPLSLGRATPQIEYRHFERLFLVFVNC
jgi:hypothetical protein